MRSDAETVDEYIEELEGERKDIIIRLREVLIGSVADLEESMRYGMPTYTKGEDIYAFNSQKQYVSLYVRDSNMMHAHADKLGKVNLGKGCVRFRHLDDVDMDAISAMLREMDSG
jgi:uncharacterized protein YdhG (YjbR/CyaY superfamily)